MGASRITRRPTKLDCLVPAFRTTGSKVGDRIEELTALARVEEIDDGKRRIRPDSVKRRLTVCLVRRSDNGQVISRKRRRTEPTVMSLPLEIKSDDAEEAKATCLRTLAALDTDCLLTLRALVCLAVRDKGDMVINLSEIARVRGWEPSSLDRGWGPAGKTRRQRLWEHVELLSRIEFQIGGLGRRGTVYRSFPLLHYDGRVGCRAADRRVFESRVYRLHPVLWNDLVKKGRALFYDPAILAADPKRDEWSIRILSYMDSRWGPNWVSKRLDQNGGRLTERLGVILDGAGIEYVKQLKRQGKPWLRRSFRAAMDKLLAWTPDPLIGGCEIDQAPTDPLQDRVTFWPTRAVAEQYDQARSKSIASRKRQSGRQRKKGGTQNT
ncbi:MAG: hypothetical protein ACYSVY_27950 [Planctomycetota bacterium]|jgi:hypothetical protein